MLVVNCAAMQTRDSRQLYAVEFRFLLFFFFFIDIKVYRLSVSHCGKACRGCVSLPKTKVCNFLSVKAGYSGCRNHAFDTINVPVTIIRFSAKYFSIRFSLLFFFFFFFFFICCSEFSQSFRFGHCVGRMERAQTNSYVKMQRSNFGKLQECADGIPIRFYVSVFLVQMK